MKHLTYELAKHEARYEAERRAMEDDAIDLGVNPARAAGMSDADLVALLEELEDAQDQGEEGEDGGSGGHDPIAALLDDLPPPLPVLPHPDWDQVGQQVQTVHGPALLVAGRIQTGEHLHGHALVELPDGRMIWTDLDSAATGTEEHAA